MSEALARRARLHWVAGKTDAAREATRAARAQTGSVIEPLRANALALMEVLTSTQAGATPDRVALDVLESIVTHCAHPLVHARHWRAQAALAAWRGDSFAAPWARRTAWPLWHARRVCWRACARRSR